MSAVLLPWLCGLAFVVGGFVLIVFWRQITEGFVGLGMVISCLAMPFMLVWGLTVGLYRVGRFLLEH